MIAEIYDASGGDRVSGDGPRLVNVSVLKPIGAGLTVGFYLGGSGTRRILVRAVGDGFELIAGERRWRAAQRAQLHSVPALVRRSPAAT